MKLTLQKYLPPKLVATKSAVLIFVLLLLLSSIAGADDGLHHESQFGTAIVSGNTISDTYNAQQATE